MDSAHGAGKSEEFFSRQFTFVMSFDSLLAEKKKKPKSPKPPEREQKSQKLAKKKRRPKPKPCQSEIEMVDSNIRTQPIPKLTESQYEWLGRPQNTASCELNLKEKLKLSLNRAHTII